MKNVAEFKRRIKVGVKLHGIYHRDFGGYSKDKIYLYKDKDIGVREITKVQSTQFALKTAFLKDGEIVGYRDSWMTFPKAAMCEFPDSDTIIIYEEDRGTKYKLLTYKFVD